MPKFREVKILPYKPKELCDLVLDVESYPKFLDWCSKAKILSKNTGNMQADLYISFKLFEEKYTSNIIHYQKDSNYFVDVTQIKGPFSHLNTKWKFESLGDDSKEATKITFEIDFEFKSIIISAIVSSLFEKLSQKMIQSFETRAKEMKNNL